MNVYDFDNTIYKGDSTADFIIWCVKRKPQLAFKLLSCGASYISYITKNNSKTNFKEKMYSFLQWIDDIDGEVNEFWKEHIKNIKTWYKNQQRDDDVIISASPEFLLRPLCNRIGINHLIASVVDKKTGFYSGINCFGAEKVRRLRNEYGGSNIESFYSDSKSDEPLAELADNAYLVNGDEITEWE